MKKCIASGPLAVLALAVSLALPGAATGCASRQEIAAQNLSAIRAETTPARLIERGDVAAMGGDLTRAEQYYVAALRAGGDERVITTKLLLVCSTDERYPSAEDYGEDYLRKHPGDTEIRYAVATVYIARDELGEARTALEQVVAERPTMAEAHYALATVLRRQGDALVEADREMREYIRLEPAGQYSEAARASLLKSVP
jgi:tetratricopeptide (TPR) repeat protein